MSPTLATVALILATLGVFLACLSPTLIEWWRKTDAAPLVVIREQDTNIRHFAYSFAAQVRLLLDTELADAADRFDIVEGRWHHDDDYVLLPNNCQDWMNDSEMRQGIVNRLLIGAGNLDLKGKRVFEKELYVSSNLNSDPDTTFRSVYVCGDAQLGENTVVARWLHSDGSVDCGDNSRLYGRVSVNEKLQLGEGSVFERISAPLIRFADGDIDIHRTAGIERSVYETDDKAVFLDEKTLLLPGDTEFADALEIDLNIVCRGALRIGANTLIKGSVKAWDQVHIGKGSTVRGAVVAGHSVHFADDVVAAGPLVAERSMHIGQRCMIGGPKMPTTVTAPRIFIAAGGQVSGSLWAGLEGRVLARAG